MIKRQIVGIIIAIVLVSILVHQVDRPALAHALVDVQWAGLILAMGLKLMSVFIKSRRWAVAIEAGSGQRVSKRLFSATLLGLGGNIVLPARMGELARLRMLARHNDVPAGFMASGAGVAYLLDAVLLSLSLVILSAMSVGPQTMLRAAVVAAVAFCVVVLLVVVSEKIRKLDWQPRLTSALRFLPDKWAAQVTNQSRGLLRGFIALKHKQLLPRLLADTAVILTLEIASVHIGLTAFGIGNSLVAAAALVVALQMSYAIPVTPGNIGTHQVISVLILGAFGIGQEAALGFSIAFQTVAHITILSLAGLVLLNEFFSTNRRRSLQPRNLTSVPSNDKSVPSNDKSVPSNDKSVPSNDKSDVSIARTIQPQETVTMHVPFFDLKQQTERLQSDLLAEISAVISSGQFCLGPAADRLETAFAKYCETDFCVAVSSGTSALHVALDCLDVGPGDEVITTPATFVATSWAIRYVGATPVFVDIDPTTQTLDPTKVEAAITPRTKAILPVHLYGRPADMFPILDIAERHEIPVIEDAAQAHGARYFGRRVGGLGRIGCFSFYPSKNLGALGEGGALVTNDPEIAARAQALRNHAQFDQKNRHDRLGYNYRMDACQAAVLNVKLRELDYWNELRRKHAQQYLEELTDIGGLQLPEWDANAESVFHLFVVCTENRDAVADQLRAAGVDTGVHYPIPVHLQPAFADLHYGEGSFPVAERLAKHCLSLPMFPEMTHHQVRYVAEQIRRIFKSVRISPAQFEGTGLAIDATALNVTS